MPMVKVYWPRLKRALNQGRRRMTWAPMFAANTAGRVRVGPRRRREAINIDDVIVLWSPAGVVIVRTSVATDAIQKTTTKNKMCWLGTRTTVGCCTRNTPRPVAAPTTPAMYSHVLRDRDRNDDNAPSNLRNLRARVLSRRPWYIITGEAKNGIRAADPTI